MRRIDHIVIHHSLTADSGTVSWGAIEDYHVKVQKWADIGYHFGVESVADAKGEARIYALVGRPLDQPAAAVNPKDNRDGIRSNATGVHVCCVGNYDLAAPPQEMYDILVKRILKPVMAEFNIAPEKIYGHHYFAGYKTCPGSKFDLDLVRRMVT